MVNGTDGEVLSDDNEPNWLQLKHTMDGNVVLSLVGISCCFRFTVSDDAKSGDEVTPMLWRVYSQRKYTNTPGKNTANTDTQQKARHACRALGKQDSASGQRLSVQERSTRHAEDNCQSQPE